MNELIISDPRFGEIRVEAGTRPGVPPEPWVNFLAQAGEGRLPIANGAFSLAFVGFDPVSGDADSSLFVVPDGGASEAITRPVKEAMLEVARSWCAGNPAVLRAMLICQGEGLLARADTDAHGDSSEAELEAFRQFIAGFGD